MEALTRGPRLSVTGKEGEGGDRRGLSVGPHFGPSARGGGRNRAGRGDWALAKGHQTEGKNTRGLAGIFLFFFFFLLFFKAFSQVNLNPFKRIRPKHTAQK